MVPAILVAEVTVCVDGGSMATALSRDTYIRELRARFANSGYAVLKAIKRR